MRMQPRSRITRPGGLAVAVLVLATTAPALAQKATEVFIPIGQSPGLSGRHTVVGRIERVNPDEHTMSIRGPAGQSWGEISDGTMIFLDRSRQRRSNGYGDVEHCRPGLFCEIKYVSNRRGDRGEPGEIEWIKIRVEDDRSEAASPAAVATLPSRRPPPPVPYRRPRPFVCSRPMES